MSCTCDRNYVEDDEHRPWCGGPPPDGFPQTAFKEVILLGDFVRYVVPKDRQADAFTRGRVVAVETYTDFHGSRVWVYVQWFDHDGKPYPEQPKYSGSELERIDGGAA